MKALHSLHVFGFGQMRETHFTRFYYCITYTVNYECSFKASFHLTNKMDYPKMHKCSQIICIISFVEIVYEKVHNYLKAFCPYGEWNIFYSISSFQIVWNVGGENGLKKCSKKSNSFSMFGKSFRLFIRSQCGISIHFSKIFQQNWYQL